MHLPNKALWSVRLLHILFPSNGDWSLHEGQRSIDQGVQGDFPGPKIMLSTRFAMARGKRGVPHLLQRQISSSKTTSTSFFLSFSPKTCSNRRPFSGQDFSHRPQASQRSGRKRNRKPSPLPSREKLRAPTEQSVRQRPHPVHLSRLTVIFTSFWVRIPVKNSRLVISIFDPERGNLNPPSAARPYWPHFPRRGAAPGASIRE